MKQIRLAHPLSFECLVCSTRNSLFYILFVVTKAGFVQSGGPKISPVHRQKCSLYLIPGPLTSAKMFEKSENL